MMHETVVIIAPEREQDFILASLRFREDMPKECRKHLLGPIVGSKGDRCFVFLPCSGVKVDEFRSKFIDHAKSNPNVNFCHIKFGGGFTSISSSDATTVTEDFLNQIKKLEREHADREACLMEEIKDLINGKHELEQALNILKKEKDEAVRCLNRDTVLAEAVSDLKTLRGKKKILEAAVAVAEEFKDSVDPPQSIRLLTDLLLEHDKIIDNRISEIKKEAIGA